LIFRMVAENPSWGAPRIHGELCKLAFEVSERTVSRWIKRTTRCPDLAPALARVSSKTSRSNRCHGFFHCADADLRGLVLFLSHRPRRRKILHCNVTRHPNALWIALQSRETWRCDQPHRFLIFDRDAKFCADVVWTVNRVSVRFKAVKLLLKPWRDPCQTRPDALLQSQKSPAESGEVFTFGEPLVMGDGPYCTLARRT